MHLLKTLGFDSDFDATAPATRQKARTRLALTFGILLVTLPLLGLERTLPWIAVALASEAGLWVATAPGRYPGEALRARTERLIASLGMASAWVVLASFYWAAGGESLRVTAVALLAGVILYAQKACERTPIHMLVVAVPPALALLILPLTLELGLAQLVGLEASMGLLVLFGASAAAQSYAATRRLSQATEELIAEREAAQAASRAKTEFLANMSHEIRTPLNGVVGVADVLSRTPLAPDQREMVDIVRGSARTLERLLSDVLDLARIEAGRVEIERRAFRLDEAVRTVAALSEMQARDKGVNLAVDIASQAEVPVLGDEVRLKQVVGNLLSNAVKFTDAGEVRVAVAARPAAGGAEFRIEVSDTGVGFDAAQRERIFGRFQQADGSITRRFGGTGLGLPITRQLTELMGGELGCESAPGRGSTFTVRLTLPAAERPDPAAAPEPAAVETQAAGLRVLLADDHAVNRKVVELILQAADASLVSVEDGRAACDAFAREPFDLVLMDMQMPVMDGLTAVREIRALEGGAARRTPVLMLTANALPEHRTASEEAGADGHVAKPITSAALLAAISAVCRSPVEPVPLSRVG